MIFVCFIFTVFGMYFFGDKFVYADDDVPLHGEIEENNGTLSLDGHLWLDDQNKPMCPNLMICFFEVMNYGLRSQDIVGETFDDATFADGAGYADRILFALAFFFIVGVILFDVVTGVILDQFGALREETGNRLDFFKETAFISGFEKSAYEEIHPSFIFEKLNNEEQDMWNYVFFVSYVNRKKTNELTGAESMIKDKMREKDITWLPTKNSYAKQEFLKKQNASASSEVSLDDLQRQVEDLQDQLVKKLEVISKSLAVHQSTTKALM